MTKFKLIGAAFALTLSTTAFAAEANCCADMACCKEGADCCKDGADCCSKGNKAAHDEHAGHAAPDTK